MSGKKIATLGSGSVKPGNPAYDLMVDVGKELAARGATVVNGGFGGAMEAAAKGAKDSSGTAVGYTLHGKPANPYVTEAVNCSYWDETIGWDAGFGIRLSALLAADGFIVAAGGGLGTWMEFMALLVFQAKAWKENPKPIAILGEVSIDERMFLSAIEGILDGRDIGVFIAVNAPDQAVKFVLGEPTETQFICRPGGLGIK